MALITQSQAGNYGLAATWAGGVVPVAGDRIICTARLDVTNARVIGTSPIGTDTTTWAIQIQPGGQIVLDGETARLDVRGWVRTETANPATAVDAVRILNGAEWRFDSSAAAAPSATNYGFVWGTALWNGRRITMDGGVSVLGSRIGVVTAGTTWQFDTTDGNGVSHRFVNAVINDCAQMKNPWGFGNDMSMSIADVLFRRCAVYGATTALPATLTWLWERVTFLDTPVAVQCFRLSGGDSSYAMVDVCCDRQWQLDADSPIARTRFVSLRGFEISGVVQGQATECFTANRDQPLANTTVIARTSTRETRVGVPDQINGKLWSTRWGGVSVDGLYLEMMEQTSTDGEYIAGAPVFASGVATVRNAVFAPCKDGTGLRSVEILDDGTSRIDLVNCTVPATFATIGPGHAGHTVANSNTERVRARNTMYVSYAPGVSPAPAKIGVVTNPVAGSYRGDQMTNNASAVVVGATPFVAGVAGKAYNQSPIPSSGTPGDGDVDSVNPDFAAIRRFADYGRSLGLSGADAAVEDAAMLVMHARLLGPNRFGFGGAGHPSYRAGVTPGGCFTYLMSGYAPRNAALQTGAVPDNDGWIGAVAGALAPPAVSIAAIVQQLNMIASLHPEFL
jgi:hypothetical protein